VQTTLGSAWAWAAMAFAAWSATWISDHGLRFASNSVADHLWYGTAVLALCPAIAVLGSRRPGTRVWTWFIQVPLLLVLGWPVLSLWLQGSEVRGLQLETPQLMAYLLVLVMGAGNYCGTKFTIPVLGFSTACAVLAISSSEATPIWLANRDWTRLASTCLLVMSMLLAGRMDRERAATHDRFDDLWLDFFNAFGVVWGRRIQDRINFIAEKERWPARLELHGFVWGESNGEAGSPHNSQAANSASNSESLSDDARSAAEARMEHTFRWLLRRFVDPPWINRRLGSITPDEDVATFAADS
jgi:hypothetical protein